MIIVDSLNIFTTKNATDITGENWNKVQIFLKTDIVFFVQRDRTEQQALVSLFVKVAGKELEILAESFNTYSCHSV